MPDLTPYSQMPGFIPSHQNRHQPGFAECAALFACGDVDAVLVELIREGRLAATHAPDLHHAAHPAGVLAESAVNAT